MKKIKNSLNAETFEKKREVFTKPSKTVPDQSLSIQEILKRYARGLPLSDTRTPLYEGEDEMPDIEKLDLAEREMLADQYRQELEEIKAKANALAKANFEKRVKEEADKREAEKKRLEQLAKEALKDAGSTNIP